MMNCSGPVPDLREFSLRGCCETVFATLSTEVAINDLSLPPRTSLETNIDRVLERIQFVFTKLDDEVELPVSKATHSTGEEASPNGIVSTVDIYYNNLEEQEFPELIRARILHEATHAIRYAMIRTANQEGISPAKLMMKTPEKKRDERLFEPFREKSLYKLESDDFHSGYWVEHYVTGGVWVIMKGELYDPLADSTSAIQPEGLCCKIVRRTGNEKYVRNAKGGDYRKFIGLEGYKLGSSEPMELFHCGKRMTRTDDDEEGCARCL